MLEYNGSKYIRNINQQTNPENQNYKKLQISTASVSSNRSISNKSVNKFSFKTGKVIVFNSKLSLNNQADYNSQNYINIFSLKQQNIQRSNKQNMNSTIDKYPQHQINFVDDSRKINRISRSQIHPFEHYPRIPSPPRKSYLNSTHFGYENNHYVASSSINWQKKKALQQQNINLKKSISQKRIRFQKTYGDLRNKLNVLTSQYRKQQSQMAKITAVVNQYFC